MASQGNIEKIYALSQEGIDLGYYYKNLEELPNSSSTWSFLSSKKLKLHGLKEFIKQELEFLELFLNQDPNCIPFVNYLFLGYPELEDYDILMQHKKIILRAKQITQKWNTLLSSL